MPEATGAYDKKYPKNGMLQNPAHDGGKGPRHAGHPPEKDELITDILDPSLQADFTANIKKIKVGDLMTLGGWVTSAVGVRQEILDLTIAELNTIARALESHTGTTYPGGVPCCCSCV